MNMLGLWASVVILVAYWLSVRTGKANTFHLANAALWIPVVVPSVLAGVWGAALLTTAFGLIGTYALWRESRT